MARRQISLSQLDESQRDHLTDQVLGEFEGILHVRYPTVSGYSYERRDFFLGSRPQQSIGATWRVSKGNFWGLRIEVLRESRPDARLRISVDGFVPCVQKVYDRLNLDLDGTQPWIARAVVGHILFILLALPFFGLLPFFVLYRLSLLGFWPESARLTQAFEEEWKRFQALFPVSTAVTRKRSPVALYAALTAIAICLTYLSWWGSDLFVNSAILSIGIFTFGFLSLFFLIALGLALFGFME